MGEKTSVLISDYSSITLKLQETNLLHQCEENLNILLTGAPLGPGSPGSP